MKIFPAHNLADVNPIIAREWHPTKNESLTPRAVAPNSNKKAWWLCKRGHEWQAVIASRNGGNGCPYCSNRAVNLENCLHTVNPLLAKEWHSAKNGSLTSKDVTPGANKKAWWLCSEGHEWQAVIASRADGRGCPYCSNKAVNLENCLHTVNPLLAKEWHPMKNEPLTPHDVTPNSGKKIWWLCERGHEWQATVDNRNKGRGCPYCSGRAACKDNCLQTINPTLASEWHPTKNGLLTPQDVTPGSDKKAWWLCKRGHEWQAVIQSRNVGAGCPNCHSSTSSYELRVYTELKYLFNDVRHRIKIKSAECDIYIPRFRFGVEVDGAYWHKNKYLSDRKKVAFLRKNGIVMLCLREKGLKKVSVHDIIFSKKNFDIAIIKRILRNIIRKTRVINRFDIKKIRIYLQREAFANESEFKKLLYMLPSALPGCSLAENKSTLAKEWHPTKNYSLTARDVTPDSNKKVWWLCRRGHEWQALVCNRNKGRGCPYCSNKAVNLENCLHTVNPLLAKEWHPMKNEPLTPHDVTPGSQKKAWWLCSEGHEWHAVIYSRNAGAGCPFCSNKAVNLENCLHTVNPLLAKEWHPTKNGFLTPQDVVPGSDKKAWWLCSKGHDWQAKVSNRSSGNGCPYCSGYRK